MKNVTVKELLNMNNLSTPDKIVSLIVSNFINEEFCYYPQIKSIEDFIRIQFLLPIIVVWSNKNNNVNIVVNARWMHGYSQLFISPNEKDYQDVVQEATKKVSEVALNLIKNKTVQKNIKIEDVLRIEYFKFLQDTND